MQRIKMSIKHQIKEEWVTLQKNRKMLICSTAYVLIDFSLTVKAAILIFISGLGSSISSTKEGKSGFIYNLVKSK